MWLDSSIQLWHLPVVKGGCFTLSMQLLFLIFLWRLLCKWTGGFGKNWWSTVSKSVYHVLNDFHVTYIVSFFPVIKMYAQLMLPRKNLIYLKYRSNRKKMLKVNISKNMLEWDSMIQFELKSNLFKHLVPFQIIYFLLRDDVHLSDFGDDMLCLHFRDDSFFV